MATKEKVSVRIDNKGRVTLPRDLRARLGVDLGDTLFVKYEAGSIRLVRAVEDPIATLATYADKEFEAGRTKDLREYMRENGL